MFPANPAQRTSLREYYLPWSSDPLENGRVVDAETKEERIRMLEQEFGQKAQPVSPDAFADENGKPHVGTVDAKGNLVTVGPKKRAAVRVLQVPLALVAAVPSIYAALFMKPTNGTPPPAGKLAAYVLYALSIITTLVMLGLYLVQPCCCGRQEGGKLPWENPLLSGVMVLPMQSSSGGKEENKKKGMKGGGNNGENNVQANPTADPHAFTADEAAGDEEEPGNSDQGYVSEQEEAKACQAS